MGGCVCLDWRQTENGPAIPTLRIVAAWAPEKKQVWEKAVQEMAVILLDDFDLKEGDVHVEIIATELEQTGTYYGWLDDPSFGNDWDLVRAKIHECLDSFEATRNHLTCLAFEGYGVVPDNQANPPTICITVDFGSDETGWPEVITEIEKMLQGEG
ncbi:hypothetical protein FBEOM_11262 [Fusarium beomiforme]|uniref:Uncharacterized protein n=1 Tax=Fusarium beomiforme TaxID=44412 RepID=A0A9P5DRK4_9HYPO|nr:hypothetical protein FBEOM_11262 [Fusarium beomiforme]